MDSQFLLLRSPRKWVGKTEVFDFYSGSLIDWDGQCRDCEKIALFKSWNADRIQTFTESHTEITLEELVRLLGNFRLGHFGKRESTSWKSFSEHIEKIQDGIAHNKFEKVVLSRVKWIDFEQPLTIKVLVQIFKEACDKYANSLVYLIGTKEHGVWIGASPEILVEIDGSEMRTMSLAGTLFNQEEEWTDKEKLEQSITAQHISESLKALGLKEDISGIKEVSNGSIRHLVQYHQANMADLNLGQVVSMLHPTPAVAGYPVSESVLMIDELEMHQRELYTGFIGDSREVYVNLRCAQVFSNGIKLYAGCGVNSQSNSEREWQETELKMKVMGDLFVV
jgi:isochorismate synthase